MLDYVRLSILFRIYARDDMEDLGLNNNFCLDKQQVSQGGTCFVQRLKKLVLASIK